MLLGYDDVHRLVAEAETRYKPAELHHMARPELQAIINGDLEHPPEHLEFS